MNKQDIIDEMRVLPAIDPDFEISRRVAFIQNQLINAGAKSLVLGISGGVDTSTCGRLAQLAVDGLNQQHDCTDYRFAAVRLPYGTQKARDGDPDEFIYDALEDLGLPLGEQQL